MPSAPPSLAAHPSSAQVSNRILYSAVGTTVTAYGAVELLVEIEVGFAAGVGEGHDEV